MQFVEDYRLSNPSDTRTNLELIRDYGSPKGGYRAMYPELGNAWDDVFRPSMGEELATGLERGWEITKGLGHGVAAYGADLLGFEGLRQDMIGGYQDNMQRAGELAGTVDFTGAMESGDFDDYISWAAGGFGELAPNIAMTVGGSLLGGGIGGMVMGKGRQVLFKVRRESLGEARNG